MRTLFGLALAASLVVSCSTGVHDSTSSPSDSKSADHSVSADLPATAPQPVPESLTIDRMSVPQPFVTGSETTTTVADYVSMTNTKSCEDDLKDCQKAVKTHAPDKNGCMPVECKAGTVEAYFRYIKNPELKAKALQMELESHDGPAASGVITPPTVQVIPPR